MRWGRPGLISDYATDTAIFRSNVARFWFAVLLVAVTILGLGGSIPLGFTTLRFDGEANFYLVTTLFAAIAAIGLNLVTGVGGQVSLGHAFFLAVGGFTAAVLGGLGETRRVFDLQSGQFVEQVMLFGFEMDMLIWLPLAGLVASLAGLIVAPIAFRLRGLYLAVVTLGLVFLGEHMFREWDAVSGGVGVGRPTPPLEVLGFSFESTSVLLGITLDRQRKLFLLALGLLLVLGLAAKNLMRSKVGRALSAIRDRDIAASMMGIDLARYKTIAFVISSFYAGITGALIYAVIGRILPESFNLLLSVEYIAMILIGGVATISGSIMGAAFITFLPLIVRWLAGFPLFGFISTTPAGGFPTIAHVEEILFGVLIVVFLIFEPLGLYGIWIRIKNYWKAWPFSY